MTSTDYLSTGQRRNTNEDELSVKERLDLFDRYMGGSVADLQSFILEQTGKSTTKGRQYTENAITFITDHAEFEVPVEPSTDPVSDITIGVPSGDPVTVTCQVTYREFTIQPDDLPRGLTDLILEDAGRVWAKHPSTPPQVEE